MIATLLVSLGLFFRSVDTVHATKETREALQNAKEEKKETEENLEDTRENIDDLNTVKSGLQGELSNLNGQLTQVSRNLENLEAQISEKQNEIEITQINLEEAKAREETQYEDMKKRIRFIYEKQEFVMTELLMQSQSFSDFLNAGAYIEALNDYDRRMLVQYQGIRDEITAAEAKLHQEMEELNGYHAAAEAEKNKVSGLVSQTASNISRYSGEIASAEAKALDLSKQIAQQEEDIKALEEKLKEEIRLSQLAKNSAWRDISQVSFADGDRYLLANLIYCEAGNQPYDGKVAVGAVVVNRVRSSVFPGSVVGVIYQANQFSPVNNGRLAIALGADQATNDCYRAADEAMSGYSNVGDRVFFRTPIPGLSGLVIGGHVFY